MGFKRKKNGNKDAKNASSAEYGHKELEELKTSVNTLPEETSAPKKRKSLLHSLRETAWNSIFEEIFTDEYLVKTQASVYGFIVTGDMLDTVQKSDESLGTFLHQINKGVIKAMVAREMLDKNYFILLCDKETLLNVEEYPFIWDIPLEAIRIDTDGETKPTGSMYHLSDILAFVNGEISLTIDEDTIGELEDIYDDVDHEIDDIGVSDVDFAGEDIFLLDEEPMFDDENKFVEEPTFLSDETEVSENSYEMTLDDFYLDEEIVNDTSISDEVAPCDIPEEGKEEVDAFVPIKEQVEKIVHRVFSEGDLNLTVDANMFYTQFGSMEVIPFSEEYTDGFLDQHLAELARNANQKLRQMRQVNYAVLRDYYMILMGNVCTSVLDYTDTNNPNTKTGQELTVLNTSRREEYENIETKAADIIADLDREWNRELEAHGEQAKEAAIASYKQRNGYRNESKRSAVRANLEREIDRGYEYGVAGLNTRRKAIASRLMDAGVNHALTIASERYITQIQEENNLRNELEKERTAFIKENYANEISRVRVLEQEMANKTEAQRVQDEYEGKLTALVGDLSRQADTFDLEKKRFTESLTNMERVKDTRFEEQVSKSEKRYKEYEKELADLRNALVTIDEKKTKEFSHRMAVYEDAISASNKRYDMEEVRRKRFGHITTAIVVGVVILGLAVGMLIGTFVNLRGIGNHQAKSSVQTQVTREDFPYESIVTEGGSTVVEK